MPETKPPCPHCGLNTTVRAKDKARGRFYCTACERSWRLAKGKPGRPPLGDRSLTNAEYCQRYWTARGDQRQYKREYMRGYRARQKLIKQM